MSSRADEYRNERRPSVLQKVKSKIVGVVMTPPGSGRRDGAPFTRRRDACRGAERSRAETRERTNRQTSGSSDARRRELGGERQEVDRTRCARRSDRGMSRRRCPYRERERRLGSSDERLTDGSRDPAVLVLVFAARVGVVARVVLFCGDGVSMRVVHVHELAMLGANLVMDEHVVQRGQHLHERELCQNERAKDAQPRRKSGFSSGAERLDGFLRTQTRRYSSTARCDPQEPCRPLRACLWATRHRGRSTRPASE